MQETKVLKLFEIHIMQIGETNLTSYVVEIKGKMQINIEDMEIIIFSNRLRVVILMLKIVILSKY